MMVFGKQVASWVLVSSTVIFQFSAKDQVSPLILHKWLFRSDKHMSEGE